MGGQKMHQTTVRFGADLWRALEDECSGLGVSVAQFVREAALARLMFVAGRRGDADYELALELAGTAVPVAGPPRARGELAELEAVAVSADRAQARTTAIERSVSEMSQSSALWAQGRLARHRAKELREEVARRRSNR